MGKLIPFNMPYVPEESKKYVLEALERNHQQGDGPFTSKASKIVSNLVGGGHVLLTPSCTHALEMASMLANIGPGDEVILPSYTFTSAATAVTKFGATPVFVDIEMRTKGIDVNQVREAISPRTKAISWVNYAGVAPEIEGLQAIAKEFNLLLIEDNAHGLGGLYKGKPLGSFGDFATQSFHATKNIQCGEGGALVINNPIFRERAEIIREKGTDRSKFVRGEVQKYQWVDQGSSYLIAESLAAILLGQLESFTKIEEIRNNMWRHYQDAFSKVPLDSRTMSSHGDKNLTHMYYLEMNNAQERDNKLVRFINEGIQATSHYQPLHSSISGMKFGRTINDCIIAKSFSQRIIRLPLHLKLQNEEIEKIIEVAIEN